MKVVEAGWCGCARHHHIAVPTGGIVTIPGVGGTGALAVATANVGASAPIVVAADTGNVALPLKLTVCQTNPANGQCINPLQPASSVTTQINAGGMPTYTVFGKATNAFRLTASDRTHLFPYTVADTTPPAGVDHKELSVTNFAPNYFGQRRRVTGDVLIDDVRVKREP